MYDPDEQAEQLSTAARIDYDSAPPHMKKAHFDAGYGYTTHIEGLGHVHFSGLTFNGNGWVTIEGAEYLNPEATQQVAQYMFERGIAVRISAINWILDDPS
jgi:hypothetical protein